MKESVFKKAKHPLKESCSLSNDIHDVFEYRLRRKLLLK